MANEVDAIWTIQRIAERDGLTRAAVSKAVKGHIKYHGLPVMRDNRGRVSGVDVETYDRLRGTYRDGSKARENTASISLLQTASSLSSYDDARIDKILADTALVKMRINAERRQLLRRDKIFDATSLLSEEINRRIDLVQHTDRIAAAYGQLDLRNLRAELKRLTHEIQSAVHDACARLALDAPEYDEALPAEGSDPT